MIAPVLCKETSALIEGVTKRRIHAIDMHLLSCVGSSWLDFRQLVIGGNVLPESRNASWRFHLCCMPLLRALARGESFDVTQPRLGHPIEIAATVHSGIELCLPSSHWSLIDDLTSAWHPELDGGSLSPSADSEIIDYAPRFKLAIDLLKLAPCLEDMVRQECEAVCVVDSSPPLPPGRCVSLTSRSVPGIVYVSVVPPILAAESLVHESAHLRLRGIEVLAPLYVSEKALVQTPLRSDLRPVSGLLHQAYVLRHLVPLYECLLESSHPQVLRNLGPTEKRFSQHNKDLGMAIRELETAIPHLTPEGQRIANLLALTSNTPIVL